MTGYPFAVALSLGVAVFVLLLLRTRRLREKYAAIWIILAIGVCTLAAVPDAAFWLANLAGVQSPINLLFSAAIVVLLGVCIQLSSEVSALEEKTRTLAEELGLLGMHVEELRRPSRHPGPSTEVSPSATTTDGSTDPSPDCRRAAADE